MKEARYRALTQEVRYRLRKNKKVEMKEARYRALTQTKAIASKIVDFVEMKEARYRALTRRKYSLTEYFIFSRNEIFDELQ